jgi:hypothetical protein
MIGVFIRRGQDQTASQSNSRERNDALSFNVPSGPGYIDRFIDKPYTGTKFATLLFIPTLAFLLGVQRGELLNYHYILPFYYSILLYYFRSAAATSESETTLTLTCASCGTAGVDDIKLKDCDDCDLVKYCSVKCQKDHWPKHKKECKKRAAELHDEILFKLAIDKGSSDNVSCVVVYID